MCKELTLADTLDILGDRELDDIKIEPLSLEEAEEIIAE